MIYKGRNTKEISFPLGGIGSGCIGLGGDGRLVDWEIFNRPSKGSRNGSEIDQMLGQWHADIVGLGDVFDNGQVKTALKSMMKNNFKESMRDFVNPWRVFSVNDESGTVICDYPEGSEKPSIPIPYCEETMTGFEYSFAGLLVANGFIDEGIKVVKAVRDRYDGEKRNPWNEIECGSNYARSMAAYALLPIFSGFEFDMVKHHIGFKPLVNENRFFCLWSLETGWGTYETSRSGAKLTVKFGEIELESFGTEVAGKVKTLIADGVKIDFTARGGAVFFDAVRVKEHLEIVC